MLRSYANLKLGFTAMIIGTDNAFFKLFHSVEMGITLARGWSGLWKTSTF